MLLFIVAVFFALLGQAGDFLTTAAGLESGVIREANPVVRTLYTHFGLPGFLALKIFYLVAALAVGTWGFVLAGFVGTGLTVWNVLQLRKAGYFDAIRNLPSSRGSGSSR